MATKRALTENSPACNKIYGGSGKTQFIVTVKTAVMSIVVKCKIIFGWKYATEDSRKNYVMIEGEREIIYWGNAQYQPKKYKH